MKKYIVLTLILVFLLGAAAMAYGFFPVMKIDGRVVTYAKFRRAYTAFRTYDLVSKKTAVSDSEIKQRALQDIIETHLLDVVIKRIDSSLAEKANQAMERAILETKNLALSEAAEKLFGLSAAEFKKIVLLPQAKKDTVINYFGGDTERLTKVWDGAVKSIEVKIYYPGYYWEEGEVKSR